MNILLGVTGSVASVLTPKLQRRISEQHGVKTIITSSASKFIPEYFDTLDDCWYACFTDVDEWREYSESQKVLHIDITKWADIFVIAPCSANTLAKIANGLCDNLLTSAARAWDFKKPFIIAPAMNCNMWSHPIMEHHLAMVESWGIHIVEPVNKELFCGDVGIGAMAHIDDIVLKINQIKN